MLDVWRISKRICDRWNQLLPLKCYQSQCTTLQESKPETKSITIETTTVTKTTKATTQKSNNKNNKETRKLKSMKRYVFHLPPKYLSSFCLERRISLQELYASRRFHFKPPIAVIRTPSMNNNRTIVTTMWHRTLWNTPLQCTTSTSTFTCSWIV